MCRRRIRPRSSSECKACGVRNGRPKRAQRRVRPAWPLIAPMDPPRFSLLEGYARHQRGRTWHRDITQPPAEMWRAACMSLHAADAGIWRSSIGSSMRFCSRQPPGQPSCGHDLAARSRAPIHLRERLPRPSGWRVRNVTAPEGACRPRGTPLPDPRQGETMLNGGAHGLAPPRAAPCCRPCPELITRI